MSTRIEFNNDNTDPALYRTISIRLDLDWILDVTTGLTLDTWKIFPNFLMGYDITGGGTGETLLVNVETKNFPIVDGAPLRYVSATDIEHDGNIYRIAITNQTSGVFVMYTMEEVSENQWIFYPYAFTTDRFINQDLDTTTLNDWILITPYSGSIEFDAFELAMTQEGGEVEPTPVYPPAFNPYFADYYGNQQNLFMTYYGGGEPLPEWFITDYPEYFAEMIYFSNEGSLNNAAYGIWQSGNLFTISQILSVPVGETYKFNVVNPFCTYTGVDGAALSNTAYNGAYFSVDLPEWTLVEDNTVVEAPQAFLF